VKKNNLKGDFVSPTSYTNLKLNKMEINLTPQDVVKMSENKVNECFDIFKEPLNLEEASSLINAILPQLEQVISDTLQEQIYDDLMDKNGGHDWIDEKLSK
jgi:DNA-binding IscR family transcriptional regulator